MSGLNEINEKVTYLDEVVNNLIKRNNEDVRKAFDSVKMDAMANKIDTLVEKTDQTNGMLETFHKEYNAQLLANVFETLDKKIAAIPKVVLTRHHHSFESKSWGYIAVLGILIAITAVAVGLAVGYRIGNQRIAADADKFEIMRALYPIATEKVNAAYQKDADSLKNIAEGKAKDKASK
ncbi:MAG: hypothetical protein ACHQIM_17240 [Sphingobacteriales bacterium]